MAGAFGRLAFLAHGSSSLFTLGELLPGHGTKIRGEHELVFPNTQRGVICRLHGLSRERVEALYRAREAIEQDVASTEACMRYCN